MSSIKKLRKAKDQIKSPDALKDHILVLAQSLLSEDRLEEALVEFEELGELCKGRDPGIEGFSYRKSGEILEKLCYYDKAYLKYQKYHDVSVDQPIELQRALTTLGGHFLAKSEFQVCDCDSRYTLDSPEIIEDLRKADNYCHRAEEAIKGTFVSDKEKEEMRCAIYANQFKICYFRKRSESSDYFFDKAERIMKENKFTDRLINLYESRTFLEKKEGRLHRALSYIDKAINASGSNPPWDLLKDKGLVLIDMRSFGMAEGILVNSYKSSNSQNQDSLIFLLKTLFKIMKIMDENDFEDEVSKLEKLGDLCARVEAYHAAIWYYDTAINRLNPESGESKSILSGLFTSLAVTYKDLMMFNLASEFYVKELELSKEVPEESFKTLVALTITTELEGKPYRSVKELFMEARSLSKQMNDVIKELYCLNEFLQFHERRGEEDPELSVLKSEFEQLKTDHGLNAEDIVLEEEEHEVDEHTDNEEDEFDIDDFIYKIDCTHKRAKRKVSLKKDAKGETELHRKVKTHGNKRDVARLIDQSVFVDIEDNAGYTPLHEACNHGHLEYVKMLISAGADVNKISDLGNSPLISAAFNGHIDVMEYLLDQGAKPYHQDQDGWSCLDYFKVSHVDHEDESYLKLHSRLTRAIKTSVATGLRLEPKKEGSSSALIVVRSDDSDDDEGHRTTSINRSYESLRSMKVNEKITKYTERNGSLRHELPDREEKTCPSSKITSDYKRTIASLGSSGAGTSCIVQTPINSVKSKAEKIYSKGIISEKEYNFVNDLEGADDWLEEDIPSRRRKNKIHQDEPRSKKIRRSSKDENSPPLNRNISTSSNRDSFQTPEPKTHFSSRKMIQQRIKPISNTPKSLPMRSSLKAEEIHRVKVKVYEKVFLIPIVDENQKVEWLANEASKRYHSATGRRLLLKLSTEDGAEVYPEDPLASIIGPNMDHFIAVITSLNSSVSLEKFYVKRCKELNRNQHKPLLNALTSAIKSGSFSIPEKIPFDLSDMEPILETLNYGLSSRLKELSIPFNSLSNINFQSTLFSLTGLKKLNLSKCGLLSHHFTDSLPQLPSLEDLDLSYNEIGDEVMEKILTTFDSLAILNLQKCGLTNDFELPFCQRKITKLNISENMLLRHGIERLLRSLNTSQLNTLDISHCGSFDSLEKILVILSEGSREELLLEHLNTSDLDLKSTISNFDVFDAIPRLKSLNISDNMNLTMPELRKLLEGLYIRNIPLEQFEACNIFSLFSHEDPDENQRLVKIFKRLVSNRKLISFKLHLDEEDDLDSFIQDLSDIWKEVHGPHSIIQSKNQVLSFGHPIYQY